ncbi:alpha,alpha-phosphotrehalase [Robertmurraya yapensis]|uniref:Alpha,alpha-phosphotrehalase n=1 Tax=Bacillus yapensis TaxID=2492960 RepID=A0A3S0KRU3_9BACI|nr:alpha,alpha-phosphotrehalase [Bacillus yapensis]RTR36346.1 alpha,alpha-phosphotrehalase [Bacillus yapensis]TKT05849.1 alpha,alpha-phosphotrehalase [Bacillus yapensis]
MLNKHTVVYQIYPKSYKDSNNDGIGDLRGVIEKLDYIKELGANFIWLTPFFVSPQNDNGYDIADYYNIDPLYGSMADVEELIAEARKRDIDIMFDMVFNHTSTKHEWFQKALTGDPKYVDYYIFKDNPTNWESKFGGNAWEYVPSLGKYYLHLFDRTQADLNWDNPEVREELKKIVRFWIEKGIKGFRFDVINLISKPAIFEDDSTGDGRKFYTDGPQIHEFLKELSLDTGLDEDGIVTVGEMSSTTIDNCIRYSNPDEKELSMCFNFHHLKVDYKNQQKWELQDCDFEALKKLLVTWQVEMEKGNGWNAVFWCNHDQPRIVSRFGNDGKYHKESAKMLATMVHFLRGTPYVYQGEEIGMTNAYFDKLAQYKDVESLNYYLILKQAGKSDEEIFQILQARSRDNSRTPMQWEDSEHAGFSAVEPWIPVIHNYADINVANSLQDEDSIFHYYKKLISLRREMDIIAHGSFRPVLQEQQEIFAYQRTYLNEELLVMTNFFEQPVEVTMCDVEVDGYQYLLSNYDERPLEQTIILRPYEAVVFYKK